MDSNEFIVPFFSSFSPQISGMSNEQMEFYNLWLQKAQNGIYIDINGQITYIFLYLYSLIENNYKDGKYDYDQIINKLLEIKEAYSEYPKIDQYCNFWLADCYLGLEQYKKALEIAPKNTRGFLVDVFNLKKIAKEPFTIADAVQEYCTSNTNITDFGRKVLDDIKFEIIYLYNEFEFQNGIEVIESCTEITPNTSYFLFSGSPGSHKSIKLDHYRFDVEKFKSYIPDSYRLAENRVRQKKGMPEIGQGWFSETQLYLEIKTVFSKYSVSQHTRLPFLGLQHLDIFIHELNIGIEYQGEQHDRPVSIFGGEEAHKKTIERDIRKKELCIKNGVHLIYVYPKYNLDDVISKIRYACASIGEVSTSMITDVDRFRIQNKVDSQYVKLNNGEFKEKTIDWANEHTHRAREYSKKEVYSYYNHALNNYKECQNSIDKHAWINILVGWCYRNKEYPDLIQEAINYGTEDINLFQDCMLQCDQGDFRNLASEMGKLFQTQATPEPKTVIMRSFADVAKEVITIYEKTDRFKDAIEMCERVINIGIRDETTKGGFEKRLSTLRKRYSAI